MNDAREVVGWWVSRSQPDMVWIAIEGERWTCWIELASDEPSELIRETT